MDKFAVQMALEGLADAGRKWREARQKFLTDSGKVLDRLIHEAAVNHMSAGEVAMYAGLTRAQVRKRMDALGMTAQLRRTKTLLADHAAKALAENSDLLGMAPHEMDLTSPLAYLPAGSELRQQITDATTAGVAELPGEKCNVCRLNDTWVDDHCTNSLCPSNLEDRLYQAIILQFEGMGEAWTTDESGDTLARAAAQVAAREVSGNNQ